MSGKCLDWDRQIHVCSAHQALKGCSRFLDDIDAINYHSERAFEIHCVVIHEVSASCPQRVLVIRINGEDKHTWNVPESYTSFWWSYAWASKPPECTVRFELRNATTGKAVMGRTAWINPEEESEDSDPDPSDTINYTAVRGLVREEVLAGSTAVMRDADSTRGLVSSVKSEIGGVSDYLTGHIRRSLSSIGANVAVVKDTVADLKMPEFPDVQGLLKAELEGLAERLWDSILDRIEERYEK